MNDTPRVNEQGTVQIGRQLMPLLEQVLTPEPLPAVAPRGRGRPVKLQQAHLWLGLLLCVLSGMNSYTQLWRALCTEVLGPFVPVLLSYDAVVSRLLEAGLAPLSGLLEQISARLAERLAPYTTCDLAPFASGIHSLDETTWDAMKRHLREQRDLPAGDPALCPGKAAGRFNIRTQQWELVQLRSNPHANCKVEILSLLEGLPQGSLLLFDLGYFSFPWFD